MDELRGAILEVQNKHRNVQGRCFVAEEDLRAVLTRGAVNQALYDKDIDKNCKLELYHIDEAVDVVINGAHRVFAILVLIRYTKFILQFIQGDNYQGSGLDQRLPFDKDRLRSIFHAQAPIEEFYDKQWHFTAPIFSDSVFTRLLPRETILPITEEEQLGEGGFGNVYRITIPPSHQRFQSISRDREVGQSRPSSVTTPY
jgi:hypothetical protein